jgi:hypothetical protein
MRSLTGASAQRHGICGSAESARRFDKPNVENFNFLKQPQPLAPPPVQLLLCFQEVGSVTHYL